MAAKERKNSTIRRGSWSYADDRRIIELAKASKSLEEAAWMMKRTPERIRQVSRRLGVSFKATGKTGVVVKSKPKQKL
jgi:hypothetical protein